MWPARDIVEQLTGRHPLARAARRISSRVKMGIPEDDLFEDGKVILILFCRVPGVFVGFINLSSSLNNPPVSPWAVSEVRR
jgi:hypothetical protein